MKIFLLIQQHFGILGINLSQPTHRHALLNSRILIPLFAFGLGAISCTSYIYYESNSFMEYIVSFYLLSSMFICFVIYMFLICMKSKFFEFIESLENCIEKREQKFCKFIFEKYLGNINRKYLNFY